jgi:hypothetical protein
MPQVLWTLYFLKAQGYKINDNILYQDNKSSILLETNGRGSSGKRTRHMNVRYFFIADRVKSKEIRIEYCPTGIMVADYFTKPLQGTIFQQLRDMIMGNTDIALPTDISNKTAQTSGIPDVNTQQESRSVLVNEIVTDKSPSSLTVLPAYGKANETRTIGKTSNQVASKRSLGLSWADVARGGKSGRDNPLFLRNLS